MEDVFLASIFIVKICVQESQAPENYGKVQNSEGLPMTKEQLREHLH